MASLEPPPPADEPESRPGGVPLYVWVIGAVILAEGVEDEAAVQAVRELGFDVVQGYAHGRPAPAAAVPAALLQLVAQAQAHQHDGPQDGPAAGAGHGGPLPGGRASLRG